MVSCEISQVLRDHSQLSLIGNDSCKWLLQDLGRFKGDKEWQVRKEVLLRNRRIFHAVLITAFRLHDPPVYRTRYSTLQSLDGLHGEEESFSIHWRCSSEAVV